MLNVDEVRWRTYCADSQFLRYLGICKDFDPVGIERALRADERSGSFDFRRVIIEAYLEDCAAGASPPFQGVGYLNVDQIDGTGKMFFSSP